MKAIGKQGLRWIALGMAAAIASCGTSNSAPTTTGLQSARTDEPEGDRVAAVYQSNPSEVTPADAAAILAYANLPASARTGRNIERAARFMLGSNASFAALIPEPDAINTDLALPVNVTDMSDVAVVLAAFREDAPTRSSLAIAASRLLPFALQSQDVRVVPGEALPGQVGQPGGLARIVRDDLNFGPTVTTVLNTLPNQRTTGRSFAFPPGTNILFPTPPDPNQALRISYEPPLVPTRNEVAQLPPFSAAELGCEGNSCAIPEDLSLLPAGFEAAPGDYAVRYTFTGRNPATNAAATTVAERFLTILPLPTVTATELMRGDAGTSKLLEDSDGTLLGTVSSGGTGNAGVIFRFDPRSASVTFARSFGGSNGGRQPLSGLTRANNGNFYGTTAAGGEQNNGTIYRLTPENQLDVVHSFDLQRMEGASPVGELLLADNGRLYGTTTNSLAGQGTAFQFDPSNNQLTTLHEFSFPGSGALAVRSPLIQASDGLLYGVNASGLFSLTLGGAFTSIPADEEDEFAAAAKLVERDRALYITVPVDDGRVLKYDLDTQEFTTIHIFQGEDGSNPDSGLVLREDGNLYGTTVRGGAQNLGTVFRIEPDDTFASLYSFRNEGDSAQPFGQLSLTRGGTFFTSSRPASNQFGIVRIVISR